MRQFQFAEQSEVKWSGERSLGRREETIIPLGRKFLCRLDPYSALAGLYNGPVRSRNGTANERTVRAGSPYFREEKRELANRQGDGEREREWERSKRWKVNFPSFFHLRRFPRGTRLQTTELIIAFKVPLESIFVRIGVFQRYRGGTTRNNCFVYRPIYDALRSREQLIRRTIRFLIG